MFAEEFLDAFPALFVNIGGECYLRHRAHAERAVQEALHRADLFLEFGECKRFCFLSSAENGNEYRCVVQVVRCQNARHRDERPLGELHLAGEYPGYHLADEYVHFFDASRICHGFSERRRYAFLGEERERISDRDEDVGCCENAELLALAHFRDLPPLTLQLADLSPADDALVAYDIKLGIRPHDAFFDFAPHDLLPAFLLEKRENLRAPAVNALQLRRRHRDHGRLDGVAELIDDVARHDDNAVPIREVAYRRRHLDPESDDERILAREREFDIRLVHIARLALQDLMSERLGPDFGEDSLESFPGAERIRLDDDVHHGPGDARGAAARCCRQ